MANVHIAYTEQGPLLGSYEKTNTSNGVVYEVENPVLLQQMGQQLGFVPVLGFTKAKKLKLKESEIKFSGELFEPQDELRNHWNSQFGSGIVLSTAPATIAKR